MVPVLWTIYLIKYNTIVVWRLLASHNLKLRMTMFSFADIFQAGSSPVSSISGFSVGSGRVDEAVDDFKVDFKLEFFSGYPWANWLDLPFWNKLEFGELN